MILRLWPFNAFDLLGRCTLFFLFAPAESMTPNTPTVVWACLRTSLTSSENDQSKTPMSSSLKTTIIPLTSFDCQGLQSRPPSNGSLSNSCEIRSLEQLSLWSSLLSGVGLDWWEWGLTWQQPPKREGLAHPAESGPGLLALQILHRGMGKLHYIDGSVPYSSFSWNIDFQNIWWQCFQIFFLINPQCSLPPALAQAQAQPSLGNACFVQLPDHQLQLPISGVSVEVCVSKSGPALT